MPSTTSAHAIDNLLLQLLPASDRSALERQGEPVALKLSEVLALPGTASGHVYFPCGGVISLALAQTGQNSLEVALIGPEGMFGLPLVLGAGGSPLRATVVASGSAWRLAARPFRQQLRRSPALQRALRQYVLVIMAQLAQAAVCARYHQLETRLARWMLTIHERSGHGAPRATHEYLAMALGVRRAGISQAAGDLQARGLIQYRRGAITVLDAPGLRSASCGCVDADHDIYARLMA